MKQRILMPTLFSLILLLSLLTAGAALAQTVELDYTWSAPTSGSPVDHYVIEQSIDGGSWAQIATAASNTYKLAATVEHSHRIRVAGIDSDSRQGAFSIASEAITPDAGPPGQPGRPMLF